MDRAVKYVEKIDHGMSIQNKFVDTFAPVNNVSANAIQRNSLIFEHAMFAKSSRVCVYNSFENQQLHYTSTDAVASVLQQG